MEPCRFCHEPFPTMKARDLHEDYLCRKPLPKPKSPSQNAPSGAVTSSPIHTSTGAARTAPPSSSPSANVARPAATAPVPATSPTSAPPTSGLPIGAASSELDLAVSQRNDARRRVRELEDEVSRLKADAVKPPLIRFTSKEGGSSLGAKDMVIQLERRLVALARACITHGILPEDALGDYLQSGITAQKIHLAKRDHIRGLNLLLSCLERLDPPRPMTPIAAAEPRAGADLSTLLAGRGIKSPTPSTQETTL